MGYFLFGVIMPSPTYPLLPTWRGGVLVWEVGGGHVEQTTAAQGLGVVDRSVVRVGHPGQVARVGAGNLDV